MRECASALLRFAKSSGIPVLLIGHINKEGSLAGPKILEHIVDTVIQFEGDQHYMYRILRSIKTDSEALRSWAFMRCATTGCAP